MTPIRFSTAIVLLALFCVGPAHAQSPVQRQALRFVGPKSLDPVSQIGAARSPALPSWADKVDAATWSLWQTDMAARRGTVRPPRPEALRVAADWGWDGLLRVDLLVETGDPRALATVPGVEVRAVAGDVAVVRAEVGALPAVAGQAEVRFVEAALVRPGLNDEGRADIRADAVHSGGGGLPRAFRGEGVVVGVLDSGIDASHPDFGMDGGTRIQYLLEYTQDGGQNEWAKAQIDADLASVTERDGNGGGGHGTHVTGTAAGSGRVLASQRGVAPAADIVFVKGVRDPDSDGGFSDADVIAGVDYVFQRAALLGKPAVVNLSLGGHYSPHDGTSLYEQALSNLGGAGRIIVAAAGNEGSSFIHAGETAQPSVLNETLVLATDPEFAGVTMWYDAGTLNQFSIGAYSLEDGSLTWIGKVDVSVGQVLADGSGQPVPFQVNGTTLGYVSIDARTTSDPRNGDGNVTFQIFGDESIDIQNVVWSVLSNGTGSGRVDLWAIGCEFYGSEVGFPDQNEMPGNSEMTVGSPSTALGVISVGSHVTQTTWTDVDGIQRQWLNPNPNGDPDSPVVPSLGQRSYFSSLGPTRDGRISPDITAPGELIFSTLSSHVTPDVGIARAQIRQGGRYSGLQGTSMASPHVAGTVALMLQADPSLTPTEAREILQETARQDGFTAAVPNNEFGSGKVDALAAVLRTLELCGSACSDGGGAGTSISEAEPNGAVAEAQALRGASPYTVTGQADHADVGGLQVSYQSGNDDIEDLYRIQTTGAGLSVTLSNFTSDLDLFVIDETSTRIVASSNSVGATETVSEAALPAGTYLVGVSFYDAGGETGTSSYTLQIEGALATSGEDGPAGGALVLHPVYPNPVQAHAAVEFELGVPADIRLAVYDVLGREVALLAEGPRGAGPHAVRFDASRLGAGTYLCRLVAGGASQVQTLVVVR